MIFKSILYKCEYTKKLSCYQNYFNITNKNLLGKTAIEFKGKKSM